MKSWVLVLCIIGFILLLHWYIYMEWRHRTLARTVTLMGKAIKRPRDLLAEEEAMMEELSQKVTRLKEKDSTLPHKEDDTHGE